MLKINAGTAPSSGAIWTKFSEHYYIAPKH